jgi:hypothetical protein
VVAVVVVVAGAVVVVAVVGVVPVGGRVVVGVPLGGAVVVGPGPVGGVVTVGRLAPGPLSWLAVFRRGRRPADSTGAVVVDETSTPRVVGSGRVVVEAAGGRVVVGSARTTEVSVGVHVLTGSLSGSTTSPIALLSTYTTFPGPRRSRRAKDAPSGLTPTTWTVSPEMSRPSEGPPGHAVTGAPLTAMPGLW